MLAAIPMIGTVLSFLGSPVGRYVAIGFIIAGAYGFGFYKGDAHGDKQCAAAALANLERKHAIEAKALKDQLAAEKKAAALLAAHAKSSEEKLRALQKRFDAAEKAAKSGKRDSNAVADAQCRVTPAGRLRFGK